MPTDPICGMEVELYPSTDFILNPIITGIATSLRSVGVVSSSIIIRRYHLKKEFV